MAAPATMLSSVSAVNPVQQLSNARMSSFHCSARTALTVRATSQSSSSVEERGSNVMVALVAAGAALTLTLTPVLPAFGSDTGDNDGDNVGAGTNSGINLKVPDVGDAVRRKVEGAKEMAENAKSTVDGSGVAQDVTNAAGEVAKDATQSVVTNSAEQAVEGVKSVVSS